MTVLNFGLALICFSMLEATEVACDLKIEKLQPNVVCQCFSGLFMGQSFWQMYHASTKRVLDKDTPKHSECFQILYPRLAREENCTEVGFRERKTVRKFGII